MIVPIRLFNCLFDNMLELSLRVAPYESLAYNLDSLFYATVSVWNDPYHAKVSVLPYPNNSLYDRWLSGASPVSFEEAILRLEQKFINQDSLVLEFGRDGQIATNVIQLKRRYLEYSDTEDIRKERT